jgi:hypothetical protein
MARDKKTDVLQGTLDMLILKTVALGPIHGYGISQRLRQMSKEVLDVRQGSLYPRSTVSKSSACCALSGALRRPDTKPSTTASPRLEPNTCRTRRPIGRL